jgi:hypothetical protein
VRPFGEPSGSGLLEHVERVAVPIDLTKVRQLKADGMGASEIAETVKIGRASVYGALGERA